MKTWITGSGCKITRLLFSRSNVFLLSQEESRLMVNTGWNGDGKRLLKRLSIAGKPDVVILTHTHFDHTGNAGLVKERFSPRFIIQEKEKDFLESGNSPVPKGTVPWTRFLYNLGAERVPQWFHERGVKADITFSERFDLSPFGLNAYIIHTPGHTIGSSSVIIDDEIALVGDALAGLPLSVFPPWGDDAVEIVRSWKKLLETSCNIFHPTHGFPVSRRRLEKEYRKRS